MHLYQCYMLVFVQTASCYRGGRSSSAR